MLGQFLLSQPWHILRDDMRLPLRKTRAVWCRRLLCGLQKPPGRAHGGPGGRGTATRVPRRSTVDLRWQLDLEVSVMGVPPNGASLVEKPSRNGWFGGPPFQEISILFFYSLCSWLVVGLFIIEQDPRSQFGKQNKSSISGYSSAKSEEATLENMSDLQRHGAVSGLLYVIVGGEGATNFPRDELHIGFKQLLIESFGRKLLGAFLQGLMWKMIRKFGGNLEVSFVGKDSHQGCDPGRGSKEVGGWRSVMVTYFRLWCLVHQCLDPTDGARRPKPETGWVAKWSTLHKDPLFLECLEPFPAMYFASPFENPTLQEPPALNCIYQSLPLLLRAPEERLPICTRRKGQLLKLGQGRCWVVSKGLGAEVTYLVQISRGPGGLEIHC